MKPTDISAPDYFHKVVDCQWACPAHTPVPEYIRLIAEGRYDDAYLINWKSNVFPGILGRTCDRPCEPACRRVRVEEGSPEHRRNSAKPEPVAICRLKRVCADYKDDIRARLPRAARLSLCTVRRRSVRRRHDAHADPEVPAAGSHHRRGSRLRPRSRHRVPSGHAHRQSEDIARGELR